MRKNPTKGERHAPPTDSTPHGTTGRGSEGNLTGASVTGISSDEVSAMGEVKPSNSKENMGPWGFWMYWVVGRIHNSAVDVAEGREMGDRAAMGWIEGGVMITCSAACCVGAGGESLILPCFMRGENRTFRERTRSAGPALNCPPDSWLLVRACIMWSDGIARRRWNVKERETGTRSLIQMVSVGVHTWQYTHV